MGRDTASSYVREIVINLGYQMTDGNVVSAVEEVVDRMWKEAYSHGWTANGEMAKKVEAIDKLIADLAAARKELMGVYSVLDTVALYFENDGTEKAPESMCGRCGDLIRWAGSPDDQVVCRSCAFNAVKDAFKRRWKR